MRSVAMRPGRIVLSVIPSGASFCPSVLNAASSPGRWALDMSRFGIGSRAAEEETLTIRPNPRSRMPGTTRSIISIGATTSSRCAASHCSRVNSSGSPPAGPPVFVTRISIGPSSRSTASSNSGAESSSSVSWTYGRAPISSAAGSIRSRVRELIATRAPSRASSAAIALPMPCDAPVTSATRPSIPSSIAGA
jgi:hypothetical protein